MNIDDENEGAIIFVVCSEFDGLYDRGSKPYDTYRVLSEYDGFAGGVVR